MTDALVIEAQATALIRGWAAHFRSQDLALKYTAVEEAKFLVLRDDLILAGIVDAEGFDFFLEAKTANPRSAKTWKKSWLLSTQALTYGLLTGGKKRYLVRRAYKSHPPSFDHEWFEFSPKDLAMWERQVRMIADEIANYSPRSDDRYSWVAPWPMNLEHGCFAYGTSYPCPFWQDGCSKHRYDEIGEHIPFFPEFDGENRGRLMEIMSSYPKALVLSASRIKTWQRCREMYRRIYGPQLGDFQPGGEASEALLIGKRFHQLLASYNRLFLSPSIGASK